MSRRSRRVARIEQTLSEAMRAMDVHTEAHVQCACALWQAYAEATAPKKIKKPKSHAGAVHYAVSKALDLGLTQRTVASQYSVSKGAISRIYRRIWREMDLDAGLERFLGHVDDPHAIAQSKETLTEDHVRAAMSTMLVDHDVPGLHALWTHHAPECMQHGRVDALRQMGLLLERAHPVCTIEILEVVIGKLIDTSTKESYLAAVSLLSPIQRSHARVDLPFGFTDYIDLLLQDSVFSEWASGDDETSYFNL